MSDLRARVAELRRKVESYDGGDRPMSPPAALLRELIKAEAALAAEDARARIPAILRGPKILDLVIADLHERDANGRQTYGSSLRASSANDALRHAYEEALDLAMYLRQEIERRDGSA